MGCVGLVVRVVRGRRVFLWVGTILRPEAYWTFFRHERCFLKALFFFPSSVVAPIEIALLSVPLVIHSTGSGFGVQDE